MKNTQIFKCFRYHLGPVETVVLSFNKLKNVSPSIPCLLLYLEVKGLSIIALKTRCEMKLDFLLFSIDNHTFFVIDTSFFIAAAEIFLQLRIAVFVIHGLSFNAFYNQTLKNIFSKVNKLINSRLSRYRRRMKKENILYNKYRITYSIKLWLKIILSTQIKFKTFKTFEFMAHLYCTIHQRTRRNNSFKTIYYLNQRKTYNLSNKFKN